MELQNTAKIVDTDDEEKDSSDVISMEGVEELSQASHKLETLRVRKSQFLITRAELLSKLNIAGPKMAVSLLSQLKNLDKEIELCKEGIESPDISVTR